ncbi:hypothetical protein LWM68_44700 [Niabella sp. W65]|nr:hypothetical protein [Niabella sp. W65]MCH7369208.1 hypothetical protein [Niabella sp. W65]ULT44757.1 hypothetical protein KRR40_16400 [Niabella sp. I65]
MSADPYKTKQTEDIKAFSNWRFQPFVDLQLGKVKLGPTWDSGITTMAKTIVWDIYMQDGVFNSINPLL